MIFPTFKIFYTLVLILNFTLANFTEYDYENSGKVPQEFWSSSVPKRNKIIEVSEEAILKIPHAKNLNEVYKILGIPIDSLTPSGRMAVDVTPNKTKDDTYLENMSQHSCSLENQSINLGLMDSQSFTHYPSCVKIKQCGGCCINSDAFTCKPTKTKRLYIKVLKLRYSSNTKPTRSRANDRTTSQNNRYKVEPNAVNVTVDEHLECKCVCKITKRHCDLDIQDYDEKNCQCVCKNTEAKTICFRSRSKYWDEKSCSCFCRKTVQCPSSQVFLHDECRCDDAVVQYQQLKKPDNNLLKLVEEHKRLYSNRTDYDRYVPNKSCFIFIKRNCTKNNTCSSAFRYRGLPVYYNLLEFGFHGTNFPEEIYSQVPLNEFCYIKLQVTTVKSNDSTQSIDWMYISSSECKFKSNICNHMLHHVESVTDFEEECLLFSLEFHENNPKHVNIGVSLKCTVPGSALSKFQYDLPVIQKECQQDSLIFKRIVNFEIHQKDKSKYPAIVMIVPCSPGGYIVNPDTGRFVHGGKCDSLFPNKTEGGRIEHIIKTFFKGNEDLLFLKRDGKEKNPLDAVRPLYLNSDGTPIPESSLLPKIVPNKEKKQKIRDGCHYLTSKNVTNQQEEVVQNEEKGPVRFVERHNKTRIGHFFDLEFSGDKEKRETGMNATARKNSSATHDFIRNLEVNLLESASEENMIIPSTKLIIFTIIIFNSLSLNNLIGPHELIKNA